MGTRGRERANELQRAYRLAHGYPRRDPSRTTCVGCDGPLRPASTKYCSTTCRRDVNYRAFIDRWLRGEVDGGTQGGVSIHIRRYLIEQGGEQCSQCGWNVRHPCTGKVPLEIDHVNGSYADNTTANLRLLCPNCHALTPTFKGLNRGNGRPYAIVRSGAGRGIRTLGISLTRRTLYP